MAATFGMSQIHRLQKAGQLDSSLRWSRKHVETPLFADLIHPERERHDDDHALF